MTTSVEIGDIFEDYEGVLLTVVAIEEEDLDGTSTVYTKSSKPGKYAALKDKNSKYTGYTPFHLEGFIIGLKKKEHV